MKNLAMNTKTLKRNLKITTRITTMIAVMAAIVIFFTLIILNLSHICNVISQIPGGIWNAILAFPSDWIISGVIGAIIASIAWGIFWHLNRPGRKK